MQTDLNIDVTLDDYRAFLSFIQGRATHALAQHRNPFLTKGLIFLISITLGIALLLIVNAFGGHIHLPSAMAAAVLVFMIVVSTVYWQMRRLQDQLLPQPDGSILGSHLYKIRDDAIHIHSSYGTTQLSWRGIKSLEETPTHFFLFIDRPVGFILPKRSFVGDSQLNLFRSAVNERCGTLGH